MVFILGVGGTILVDLQDQQCDDVSGTQAQWLQGKATAGHVFGCCSNVTNATHCGSALVGSSVALNSTASGLEGIETISDWTPTIGLVIVIGLVIAILIGSLGFALGGLGRKRA